MPHKDPRVAARSDKERRARYRREFEATPEGKLAAQLRRTKELRKEEIARSSTIDAPLPSPARELKIKGPAHGLRIAYIPDTQVRDDVPTDHISHAGQYIADKQPDVIVCAGDWWDMPTLGDHDEESSEFKENKRVEKDIELGCEAMERFLEPIAKARGYNPRLVFTLGNHEDRIVRARKNDPRRFTKSIKDLKLNEYGWTVVPFLQPIVIGGVAFCHYFPTGKMGHACTTAKQLLQKQHMSCVAGHQQGRDIAYERNAAGIALTGLISGSFYQHNEPYLSPLANRHWRGMYMLHEVRDGQFDEMAVSINFLKRKFGR